VLKTGVIKATPNRKCYMWYAKMCMLDSNFWCLNVEIMHNPGHLKLVEWFAVKGSKSGWNVNMLKCLAKREKAWYNSYVI